MFYYNIVLIVKIALLLAGDLFVAKKDSCCFSRLEPELFANFGSVKS